jgi:hypothetical protein
MLNKELSEGKEEEGGTMGYKAARRTGRRLGKES